MQWISPEFRPKDILSSKTSENHFSFEEVGQALELAAPEDKIRVGLELGSDVLQGVPLGPELLPLPAARLPQLLQA